jgi:hypothetical protein
MLAKLPAVVLVAIPAVKEDSGMVTSIVWNSQPTNCGVACGITFILITLDVPAV